MLSGLSSLLWGSGGGGRDDAAVDQTQASQSPPLDTQDTDNGWVLVDVTDQEAEPVTDLQPANNPAAHPLPPQPMEEEEQAENEAHRPAEDAVLQRNARRLARAARANEEVKMICYVQRQQQVAKMKPHSRRRLEAGNKTRMFQSRSRKASATHNRVLRPSGQINGRRTQRHC